MSETKSAAVLKAERVVRLILKARREQLTTIQASAEFRQNHTRATFGHKYVGRFVPINLDEPPDQVPYNPGWEPPLRTLEPNFKEKNVTHFWVILKLPDGKNKVLRDDFKLLCRQGKECKRPGCAVCWVAYHLAIPKGASVVIREVPSNERVRIEDPAGVDPKGFRPQGKSLGEPERDQYKLTSTQTKYKGNAGAQ